MADEREEEVTNAVFAVLGAAAMLLGGAAILQFIDPRPIGLTLVGWGNLGLGLIGLPVALVILGATAKKHDLVKTMFVAFAGAVGHVAAVIVFWSPLLEQLAYWKNR